MIENKIIKAEKELISAMKTGNIHALDDLLHDNLLFNGPDGKTITKSMDIGAYLTGNMEIKDLISSDQEISIVDDTAIVTVTVELKGSFMKKPISGKYRYLRIWKEFSGSWKVIGGSCVPLLE